MRNTLYTVNHACCYAKTDSVILFLVLTVAAAGQSYKVENISPENGLSNSWVSSILQDEEGFMWFGTWNGLNRYDGYDFTVFKPVPGDSLSLSNNAIKALCEDNSGQPVDRHRERIELVRSEYGKIPQVHAQSIRFKFDKQ